jgi:acyl-homoserine-lactone acylase
MYADLSVVPDVSAEQLKRCAPSKSAAALFGSAGITDIAVLDGSRSDCDWNRDPAAPVPGLIPPNRMPVLIRNDWVQNSNDSYWLSHPGVTIPDISPMVGQVGVLQRLRTRSGIEEIRARLSGRDELSGNKMGLSEVQAVLFRNRNKAGQLVVGDLAATCANATDSEIREACAALQGWDRNNNIDSHGAPLFREFWRIAAGIPNVWRVPFDPADPIGTPTGLNLGDITVRDKVFDALVKAVRAIKKAGFSPDAALGAVQFRGTSSGRVAIHGGDEFEGVLNKIGTIGPVVLNENGFIVDFGSSYLQTVTFDERGPLAQGLLTYGQSSNPPSPHAYDQLPSFSRKQWIDLPFHPRDVEAQAEGPELRLRR